MRKEVSSHVLLCNSQGDSLSKSIERVNGMNKLKKLLTLL